VVDGIVLGVCVVLLMGGLVCGINVLMSVFGVVAGLCHFGAHLCRWFDGLGFVMKEEQLSKELFLC
jgi:hypothetical protein